MAENKEYDLKAFAAGNLNAQKANMRIDLKLVDAREGAVGSKKSVPVVTIQDSPFDHTDDLRTLGLKKMWETGFPLIQGEYDKTPYEGYDIKGDRKIMTVTGEKSLNLLADAGVEFPSFEQFMSLARKVARGGKAAALG